MPATKSDKENLSVINQFRSTPTDRDYFLEQAEKSGISFSEYALCACRDGKMIIKENSETSLFDSQVVYELNKSGVNLMQFLKKYHSTGHPPPSNFSIVVDEHRALLTKVANLVEE